MSSGYVPTAGYMHSASSAASSRGGDAGMAKETLGILEQQALI
jgi:hypothetical protein